MSPSPTSPEKSTKYAIAASKGFSYYLPKTAQQHLRALLKQLPSAARPIYNEYYRDIMCAKACAADSAAAMGKFVESFPRVKRVHNVFAREMNEEIEGNEHEGYEPVAFPVVDEMELEVEVEVEEVERGVRRGKGKRKALSTRALAVKKKRRISNSQDEKTTMSVTPPPSSPAADPRSDQSGSTHSESRAHTADTQAADVHRPTLESLEPVEEQKNTILDPETSDEHASSQKSASPQQLHTSTSHGHSTAPSPSIMPSTPLPATAASSPREDGDLTTPPELSRAASAAGALDDMTELDAEVAEGQVRGVDAVFDYAFLSEEERWEEGRRALEEFEWS